MSGHLIKSRKDSIYIYIYIVVHGVHGEDGKFLEKGNTGGQRIIFVKRIGCWPNRSFLDDNAENRKAEFNLHGYRPHRIRRNESRYSPLIFLEANAKKIRGRGGMKQGGAIIRFPSIASLISRGRCETRTFEEIQFPLSSGYRRFTFIAPSISPLVNLPSIVPSISFNFEIVSLVRRITKKHGK